MTISCRSIIFNPSADKVENVVKPPQNPVPAPYFSKSVPVFRSSTIPMTMPNSQQPTRLATSVGNGKPAETGSHFPNKARNTLPAKPPAAIQNSLIPSPLFFPDQQKDFGKISFSAYTKSFREHFNISGKPCLRLSSAKDFL